MLTDTFGKLLATRLHETLNVLLDCPMWDGTFSLEFQGNGSH